MKLPELAALECVDSPSGLSFKCNSALTIEPGTKLYTAEQIRDANRATTPWTPGPWSVFGGDDLTVVDQTNVRIGRAETFRDARLMSLAPEMAELLSLLIHTPSPEHWPLLARSAKRLLSRIKTAD